MDFDKTQENILILAPPLIIIGPAGSGKTALVLEKLGKLEGSLAYITLSPLLVENSAQLYSAGNPLNKNRNVEFLSLNDYLASWKKPLGHEINYQDFSSWFKKKIKAIKTNDPLKVFEEFKGVLTGADVEVAWLSREKYLSLGIKQSLFDLNEREDIYRLFESYLSWINESHFYENNLLCFHYLEIIKPRYDYIIVDEVQDLTNIQLKCILGSLRTAAGFILTGDSHQVLHPNFFSWSKIKTLFYGSGDLQPTLCILQKNYRNSAGVLNIGNRLLKIKTLRFGSIDRESSYLAEDSSSIKGEIRLYGDDEKSKQELNLQTEQSKNFAVIVPGESQKEEASRFFKTPLIFSIREAKGLEYENVILLNFVSFYSEEFNEISSGLSVNDLRENAMVYNRASSKHDKSGELSKFYINSLYVALTRATTNVYLFEQDPHNNIFDLLEISENGSKIKVAKEVSGKDEWLAEAVRLEKQGNKGQAEKIRAKYLDYEYIEPAELETLLASAFDTSAKPDEVKKERKLLFQYALHHLRFDWIEQLAATQFPRAVLQVKEIRTARKEFARNVRLGRSELVFPVIEKYGTEFTSEAGETALMLALYHAQDYLVTELLNRKPRLTQIDGKGWMAVDYLLRGFFNGVLLKQQQVASIDTIQKFWLPVCPASIILDASGVMLRVTSGSALFPILIIMRTMQELQEEKHQVTWTGIEKPSIEMGSFSIDELIRLIRFLPQQVLPLKDLGRSLYIDLLSANEIGRKAEPDCKPLFQRMGEDRYMLNPDITWIEAPLLSASS